MNMILRRIILALGFVHLTLLEETRSSAESSSVLVVKNNVTLTCPCKCNATRTGKNKEFRVTLQRGTGRSLNVCSGSFNLSYIPFDNSTEELSCVGIPSETRVTFHLWNLKVTHTDIYFCYTEIMYPPPYSNSTDNGMVIHVREDLSCPSPEHQASWLMQALLGVLAIYTLFVSVALFCCWRRSKASKALQSDYMNMTPRRAKNKQYQPYAPTQADRLR